jgi:leucine-rich repeat protein SHOC2
MMIPQQVVELIERARIDRATKLDLSGQKLTELPDSIGDLDSLVELDLSNNQLTCLPDSIGNLTKLTRLNLESNRLTRLPESIGNLVKLTVLNIYRNRLTELPESIGNLTKITQLRPCKAGSAKGSLKKLPESIGNLSKLNRLSLQRCQLNELPESIGKLSKLKFLNVDENSLSDLPESIGKLAQLQELKLSGNQIAKLPQSMANLRNLETLFIDRNPLTDLSMLQGLSKLGTVVILNVALPDLYWTKFSDWKVEWLLNEGNAEIRRVLVEQLGYEKICDELGANAIDTWQEYTLLKIDNIQIVYQGWQEVGREPMMLLKMTCPSTGHIHILRVPPNMTSAEDAIVWVNHGIHPSEFSVQT